MKKEHQIKHLYWRAGFGLTPSEWQKKKSWSVQQAVDELFQQTKRAKKISASNLIAQLQNEQLTQKERQVLRKKITQQQNIAWVERMANAEESALMERMSLFWHGHFACETKIPFLAATQINSIQQHALGNFRDLVVAIAKDVSMIRYLNNQQNRKGQPNENFARELMELFTIGRGNYTEQDVRESARAFTGWSSTKEGIYIFRDRQHDFGRKTFMGKSGNFDGEDIIDMILQKRETATFICRKIYRYFVNDQVNESRVKDLSILFYRSNYDIGQLMRHIFTADWFYNQENVGTKIKAPVELLVGMMRQIDLSVTNKKALGVLQRALGQILFNPPNVAGWPGGKNWIDNSTLMLRLNLPNLVFQASDVDFKTKDTLEGKIGGNIKMFKATYNLQPLLTMIKRQDNEQGFTTLCEFLLQAPTRLNYQQLKEFLPRSNTTSYVKMLTMRLMSLPEYQMC